MLTAKQRAFLRSLAQNRSPALQIGKEGLSGPLIRQADEYLVAHELLKVQVGRPLAGDVRPLAEELAAALNADVVQVIGHRFVLYRRSEELHLEGNGIILPR
ncbi:MAG: YhbY family RNA-binding protein [Bacillota bacterium]|nr:YhbY family RNA-binding protein [Bacillota bacterium]